MSGAVVVVGGKQFGELRLSGHRTTDGSTLWAVTDDEEDFGVGAGPEGLAASPGGGTFLVAANVVATPSEGGAFLVAEHSAGDGVRLWSARHRGAPGAGFDATPRVVDLAPDPECRRVLASARVPAAGLVVAYDAPSLAIPPAPISLGGGASRTLHLRAGAAHAGRRYRLLGSLGGVRPGVPLPGGSVLPLFPRDAYFAATSSRDPSFLRGSSGVLDAHGAAEVRLALPPTGDASLAGLELTHAFLVLDRDGGVAFVSEPNSVRLAE